MQLLEPPVLVDAPLDGDRELRRWYAEGGERCLALTAGGKLLEPLPAFGPARYRLIATAADIGDARRYAMTHGFRHLRRLDRRLAS